MSMEMEILDPGDDRRRDEHEAFSIVTAELEEVANCDGTDPDLHRALIRNRQLWSKLEENLYDDRNLLPVGLKEQLISLAGWVDGYTNLVDRGEGDVSALIRINATIMEGLAA